MTTLAIIKECLLALKDRTGSSIIAINKWIEAEKKVSPSDDSELKLGQMRILGSNDLGLGENT